MSWLVGIKTSAYMLAMDKKQSVIIKVVGGQEFVREFCSLEVNEDMHDRIHYMRGSKFDNATHIVGVLPNGKVVADIQIETSPYNENEKWFMHVAVDLEFRGRGLPLEMGRATAEYLSGLPNLEKISISSLSRDGRRFLKPVMRQLGDEFPALLSMAIGGGFEEYIQEEDTSPAPSPF